VVLYNRYSIAMVQNQSMVYQSGESDTKFGFESGGGLRYYVETDTAY
jgi:hypothetical protein